MARKLVGLFNTKGKSSEEVSKEDWKKVADYIATGLGLEKCEACGGFKGMGVQAGQEIRVSCLCDGILCKKCKKVPIPRPISNFFFAEDLKILHVPFFQNVCGQCMPIKYV